MLAKQHSTLTQLRLSTPALKSTSPYLGVGLLPARLGGPSKFLWFCNIDCSIGIELWTLNQRAG